MEMVGIALLESCVRLVESWPEVQSQLISPCYDGIRLLDLGRLYDKIRLREEPYIYSCCIRGFSWRCMNIRQSIDFMVLSLPLQST